MTGTTGTIGTTGGAAAGPSAASLGALEGAVLALSGVAGLHAGSLGEVATFLPGLPGRRLTGVRVRDGVVDVHVTLAEGAPLRATAVAVRDAVAALVHGAVVDVTVEDVDRPGPRAGRGRSRP